MPKRGFKVITIRTSTYDELEELAAIMDSALPSRKHLSKSDVVSVLVRLRAFGYDQRGSSGKRKRQTTAHA